MPPPTPQVQELLMWTVFLSYLWTPEMPTASVPSQRLPCRASAPDRKQLDHLGRICHSYAGFSDCLWHGRVLEVDHTSPQTHRPWQDPSGWGRR